MVRSIVSGATHPSVMALFHIGRVKSLPAKEALFASLGSYLPVAGILFALTRGFYPLLGKISNGSK